MEVRHFYSMMAQRERMLDFELWTVTQKSPHYAKKSQ